MLSKIPLRKTLSNFLQIPIINKTIDKINNPRIIFPSISVILPFLTWIILSSPEILFNEKNFFRCIQFLFLAIFPILIITSKPSIQLDNKKNPEDIPNHKSNNFLIEQFKTVLSLSPIALIITFMLTLYYYNWVTQGNINLAFRITSLQLTQDRYQLIPSTVISLFIIYLILIPSKTLDITALNMDTTSDSKGPQKNLDLDVYIRATWHIAIFTLFAGFPAWAIYSLMAPQSYIDDLALFVFFAFVFGQIKLLSSSPLETIDALKSIAKSAPKFKGLKSILFTLLVVLILLKFPTSSLVINAGKGVVDIGSTSNNPMHAYSCIFTLQNPQSESISFGIVVESKDKYLHIFTPTYNQEKNSYTQFDFIGNTFPLNPTESYISIKEDYRIEQYNESIHEYNSNTGKCKHK